MASDFSFDITCDFDKQELQNAIDQTRREIQTRFDFKGVMANIDINNKELIIHSDSDHKVRAVVDIIESKLIKRNLPLSILDKTKSPETAAGGTFRQTIKLIDALDQEQIKELTKIIRNNFPKAKSLVQGDEVRIFSKSKDELQQIIQYLKNKKNNLPLRFTNFR